MVGAVIGCTGKQPILVGKPDPLLLDYIIGKYGVQRERMCMVGDRLDTDVLFGSRAGVRTVLTLSGCTDLADVTDPLNSIVPDYIVRTIADLIAGCSS
jgi:4-nitrophenyl phosphatase/phosphoglycolate phosphatase